MVRGIGGELQRVGLLSTRVEEGGTTEVFWNDMKDAPSGLGIVEESLVQRHLFATCRAKTLLPTVGGC